MVITLTDCETRLSNECKSCFAAARTGSQEEVQTSLTFACLSTEYYVECATAMTDTLIEAVCATFVLCMILLCLWWCLAALVLSVILWCLLAYAHLHSFCLAPLFPFGLAELCLLDCRGSHTSEIGIQV